MDWRVKLSEAKAVSGKARLLVEAEARQAKEVAGKAKRASSEHIATILQEQWPRVQHLFRATLQTTAAATLYDDKRMRRILLIVYGELPVLFRIAVEADEFIQFCLNNRDRLLPPADAGRPAASKQLEPG